ncbi:nucleotidyltransferase family protein [Shouchella shacheensis]|uniref:nucleotidyltransferase family protein n=1 Tax=Shouchella shacheensis TaxID=1649580 RepID=UPI00073FE580|nr:nucleotidyltransferase domain-containing protein [Shouchella shacheensis]
MSTLSNNREATLALLKSIIQQTLRNVNAEVYLFGSWARKEEKRTSDIDIGILSDPKIPEKTWVALRDAVEESLIPYHVELVDLTSTSSEFLAQVKKEGILWKG